MDARLYLQKIAHEMIDDGEDARKEVVASRFPLTSPQDVYAATHWFEEHVTQIPSEYRRPLAQHIQKHASAFSMRCEGALSNYLGEASADMIDYSMKARAMLSPEHKEDYAAIAKLSLPREKLAMVIAEMDMAAGINTLWDTEIPDPWRTLYTPPPHVKQAEKSYKVLTETITETDLRALSEEMAEYLERRLGVAKARQFQEDPIGVFERSSEGMKRVLAEMARTVKEESR